MTILEKTAAFDWNIFCEEARNRRFTLTLSVALSYLKSRLGAPVPGEVLKMLESTPVSEFERADYLGITSPRNATSGWQRGHLMWRRYREWKPDAAGVRRWVGFAVFLQHHTHKPNLRTLLFQLIKGRFQ